MTWYAKSGLEDNHNNNRKECRAAQTKQSLLWLEARKELFQHFRLNLSNAVSFSLVYLAINKWMLLLS